MVVAGVQPAPIRGYRPLAIGLRWVWPGASTPGNRGSLVANVRLFTISIFVVIFRFHVFQ